MCRPDLRLLSPDSDDAWYREPDDDPPADHVNEHESPIGAEGTPASREPGPQPESTPAQTAAAPAHAPAPEQAEPAAPADAPPPGATATPAPSISRGRLIGVDALIVVTTILAVVAMLAVWANRLLFNPHNWSTTSTQLLEDPAIRSAASNYIVDQLYANVNVAGLIKSGLPPRLDPLAGPAAGALRNVAVQGVDAALQRPRVQSLWAAANRRADQAFIAVVNGGKGPVGVKSGQVTLDLGSILDTVAARFGLPSSLSSKLPPNVATLTVFKSDQLSFVQKAGKAVQGLALWLSILVPLLYALAILLAPHHRRRTLMSVGFALLIAGVVGLAGRAILKSAIVNSLVTNEAQRPAARATVGIGTALLAEIAAAFIVVGIVVVIAAWFAGPARLAVTGRRWIAPFMREQPVWCFAIVVVVMIVIFIWQPIPATGTPVGIVVFMALAVLGTEVLRRQMAVEFPDARMGDAATTMRTRLDAFMEARRRRKQPPSQATASLPEQLERLATLRESGAITPEEYDAAKANLLHV